MRILSKEFPTALFRSTAPGWVQSSAHQPSNRTISIAYHLKNFLLWIIFINIVNNYTLNFKVYLGEVDLVTVLSKPKPNNDTFLSQSLENILRGIYVRNEVTYLKHINETTIVAKPIFICNDNSISVILNEGFYAGEGKKLKLGNRTMVQNTFIQRFPHKSTISHFKSHIQVVQEVLEIFLNRLYDESGLDIVNVIKKLKNVIGPVTIGKLGLFVNSFVIFTLYSVFHCVPKTLLWHNINLALLYFTNTVNISFILMILISKSRLRDYSNDFSYSLLILEFISFLAVMLLFFNDHKTIMAREAILPYSCSSSVYSERNSKACDLKPDNIQPAPPLAPALTFNPEHTADPTADPPLPLPLPPPAPPPVPVTDTAPNATDANDTIIGPPPPPLQDHSTQLLPKCKSQPIFQQQPTTRPPQRYSFHIQTLQEPYITPIPLTTSVVNTQLQPATNPPIPPRNPERRCVTVPVSLPKKFDALHLGTVAGHPGHLPNLQL